MSENTYNLSQGYDSLAAEMLYANMNGPDDEVAFYERRIRSNGGSALDQACGTGRHLFPLLKRGLDIHGTDASTDALRFARMKAEESNLRPQLYHQRMEDFDVPHRYGTIYIPNGSFQLISDRQKAIETLERFRNHLIPGGQLLMELAVPEEVTGCAPIREPGNPQKWGPTKRNFEEGEIKTTLWTESFDLFEQTLVEKRRYELLIDGQVVRAESHTLHMRWYYKYEFIMMLENLGFEDIYLYSDWTEQPATKDSKIVVYGARNSST